MPDISIEDKIQRTIHFTGAMWKANVGDDPELIDCKVAPALEVVTHCSLNKKLSCEKLTALQIRLHFFIADEVYNPLVALTTVTGHQNSSCAKVIPCNPVNVFALFSLENNAQAEHIVALGNLR